LGRGLVILFLLAKREWGIDTSSVYGAHELNPILCRLRDALASWALTVVAHRVQLHAYDSGG
jgi:hypothetical protein